MGIDDALATLEKAAIEIEIENRLTPATPEQTAEFDRIIRRFLHLRLARFGGTGSTPRVGPPA